MVEFCLTCGVPASGKTSWAKEQIDKGYIWLSSDEIRKEHNYQILNQAVFDQMYVDSVRYLDNGCNVIYDATNLNAKRRKHLISSLKAAVHNEVILFRCEVFIQPIEMLYERNAMRVDKERVPDEVIHRMLTQFQFPQYFEGWDSISINSSSRGQAFRDVLFKDFDQKNPHHKLNLYDHLVEAMKTAGKSHFGDTVRYAAWNHDMGKIYTQTIDDNEIAHYYGHENMSAYMYILGYLNENIWYYFDEDFFEVVFLINYHMRPYNWTEKSYERDIELFGEEYCRKLKMLHACDIAAH